MTPIPALTALWLLALGFATGALVNYLADVLPWKRRLAHPFCLACDSPQPLRNYLLWPRRCPVCSQPRTRRAWLVELAFIGLTFWLWAAHPEKLGFWGGMLVLFYFGVIIVIDAEHRLILHPTSWAGLVIGLAVGWYLRGPWSALAGGAAGYGSMLLLFWLGEQYIKLVSKLRGQPVNDVALGFGDVNLSGVLGLMLGWPGIVPGLVFGFLIAAALIAPYLVIQLLLRRYTFATAWPFGPFLIAGAALLLFFSAGINRLLGG